MSHRASTQAVLLGLVLVVTLLSQGAVPVCADGDFTEIDRYVTAAMKRHNIPGVALAISDGGQIAFSQGYGSAGGGRAVTPDTPFYIGSQSKSFTALAILQLMEQGNLELDAPVQTYLPWFQVADAQASQRITIRHLLQHTSGLSERDYPANFPPDTPLEDVVRGLSRVRLSAPVGERMQYFNPGYSVLGLVIETLSGQSYGDFIREHIFVPLKMAHSFTDPAEAEAAGLAQGYGQIFGFAAPLRQRFYSSDLPAGFIVSTANDMARYLIALGNGGELDGARVLEAENVELLFTPNTAIGSTYGFGWMIGDYYGELQLTHGGDTERFHTAVLLLPENGRSLVLLINENHLLKDLNEYNTMLWGLASIMTDQPMPQERLSSTIYGWGLLAIWIYTLVSLVRKAIKLPQWRAKIVEWNALQRWTEIIKHSAYIGITVLIVTVVAPALMGRAFVWKWFVASLPEAAIIAATLILDDMIQLVYKLGVIIQAGRRRAV